MRSVPSSFKTVCFLFVCFCLYMVCMCICLSHMCGVGVHVCSCMYTWTCGGLRCFMVLPLYLLRHSLSVRPRVRNTASLTSQLALEIPCVYFLWLELQVGHHIHPVFTWALGSPNYRPHDGSISASTTEFLLKSQAGFNTDYGMFQSLPTLGAL